MCDHIALHNCFCWKRSHRIKWMSDLKAVGKKEREGKRLQYIIIFLLISSHHIHSPKRLFHTYFCSTESRAHQRTKFINNCFFDYISSPPPPHISLFFNLISSWEWEMKKYQSHGEFFHNDNLNSLTHYWLCDNIINA